MNIKTNTFNFIPNIAISSEKYKENGMFKIDFINQSNCTFIES